MLTMTFKLEVRADDGDGFTSGSKKVLEVLSDACRKEELGYNVPVTPDFPVKLLGLNLEQLERFVAALKSVQ